MENESTVLANLIQGLQKDRDMFLKRGLELATKRCESSEVAELFTAFVKAQAEFGSITKSSKAYNYKYANLESILAEVRPALNKNNLALYWFTDENNILYTRIRHISGEFIESRIKLIETELDSKKSAEQAYGSSSTYMRRYQLLAILGLQPEAEDDDGASTKRV